MIPVWTYWSGPMPDWIALCLESLRKHCPTLKVLDDSWWHRQYDGSLPIQLLLQQPPNLRSDVMRAFLLSKHGGVWVDADCIAFRNLADLSEILVDHEFITYQQRHGGICSALAAARPQSMIAFRWWNHTKRAARKNIKRKRWHRLSLGPRLLRAALRDEGWRGYCVLPGQLVHPLYWRHRAAFSQDTTPTIDPQAWCCMLTSGSLGEMAQWPRDRLLDSPTWIGRVFRHALEVA
jgi:hypothetical protein